MLALVPAAPVSADAVRDSQWHLGFLDVAEAHRHSQGEGVVVAVVDSGVDAAHPDLDGAVVPGMDMLNGDGRKDSDGHGTAMAGLVAARGRSGQTGALGVAPLSTIIPVDAGYPLNTSVDDAVAWAVDHGAKVICVALGSVRGGPRTEQADARAVAADIVVVAAAGNRPDTRIIAPARYPGVVAAVGVDRAGNHAEVSVTGPEAVLAAPAVDIVSTDRGGKYQVGTGTSDATAIIAGVAALVRAKYPQLSAPEVIHRMTATAIDKGAPGRDEEYGFGIVDPVAALTAEVPPLAGTGSPTPPGGSGGGVSLVLLLGGVLLAVAGVGGAVGGYVVWRIRRRGA